MALKMIALILGGIPLVMESVLLFIMHAALSRHFNIMQGSIKNKQLTTVHRLVSYHSKCFTHLNPSVLVSLLDIRGSEEEYSQGITNVPSGQFFK